MIFDLDGVLVDSRAVFLSCVNFAFADLELPTRPTRAPALHRPAIQGGFSELLGDPTTPVVDALHRGYRGHYATVSLTETTVAPGMPEALAALDRTKAVATSKPHPLRRAAAEAMGLREHFAVVAGPELTAAVRPKRRRSPGR